MEMTATCMGLMYRYHLRQHIMMAIDLESASSCHQCSQRLLDIELWIVSVCRDMVDTGPDTGPEHAHGPNGKVQSVADGCA